jgi:threonine/homoserine/homoserine lactone efflux protein
MILETNQALFLAEVFGVLAMPGPTNSLLFVSGATRGLRAGLHLPLAEVTAYLMTVSILIFVVGPAAEGHSIVGQLLRVLCSIYLAYMAVFLWRAGTPNVDVDHPMTALRIVLTTLVNPKNLLFAFAIFPAATAGSDAMLFSFVSFRPSALLPDRLGSRQAPFSTPWVPLRCIMCIAAKHVCSPASQS